MQSSSSDNSYYQNAGWLLTLVLRSIFPNIFSEGGGLLQPPMIINMEGHISLNLLPLYSYGCPLSIDTAHF